LEIVLARPCAGSPVVFCWKGDISAGTALELTASAGFVETAAVAAKFSR